MTSIRAPSTIARPLALLLVALLSLLGSALLAPAPASAQEPRIVFFRVVPTVRNGETWHEFHWEVLGVDRVRLFSDGREMESRIQLDDGSFAWPTSMAGSFRTTLSRPSRFRLVAEGPRGGRVEQSVVVEVVATKPPTVRDHRPDARDRQRVVTVRHTAFCKITGRVTGGWRREIAERPGGPTSTWIVDMLLFKAGERRPTAQARVRGGRYVFDRVPIKGAYFVSPSWKGQPTRVDILTCRAGRSHQIQNIHISGGPMID